MAIRHKLEEYKAFLALSAAQLALILDPLIPNNIHEDDSLIRTYCVFEQKKNGQTLQLHKVKLPFSLIEY